MSDHIIATGVSISTQQMSQLAYADQFILELGGANLALIGISAALFWAAFLRWATIRMDVRHDLIKNKRSSNTATFYRAFASLHLDLHEVVGYLRFLEKFFSRSL